MQAPFSNLLSSARIRYALVVMLFIGGWLGFDFLEKLPSLRGTKAEYYGCMAIVFLWGLVLRKRLEDVKKPLSALLPFATVAVLVEIVLIKFSLVSPSAALLLCIFVAQVPALMWRGADGTENSRVGG